MCQYNTRAPYSIAPAAIKLTPAWFVFIASLHSPGIQSTSICHVGRHDGSHTESECRRSCVSNEVHRYTGSREIVLPRLRSVRAAAFLSLVPLTATGIEVVAVVVPVAGLSPCLDGVPVPVPGPARRLSATSPRATSVELATFPHHSPPHRTAAGGSCGDLKKDTLGGNLPLPLASSSQTEGGSVG